MGSQAETAQKDPLFVQLAVFVGLIAKLTDSTQQETIDRSVRQLHALGNEVLAQSCAAEGTESRLLSCLMQTAALPKTNHPHPP